MTTMNGRCRWGSSGPFQATSAGLHRDSRASPGLLSIQHWCAKSLGSQLIGYTFL